MSNVRVGLDLDGVLYDFVGAMRHWYVEQHDVDVAEMPTPNQWHIPNCWPHLNGDLDQFHEDCQEALLAGHLCLWGTPFKGVALLMDYLALRGFEVHLITARDFGCGPALNHKITSDWLRREGLPYTSLTISSDKTVVPTDVFLDDRPENVEAVLAAGSCGVLYTQPYNLHRHDLPRVDSLGEFAEVVDSISSIKDHSNA